ncbi:hypothetical protein D3C87_35290 [compost metagenome]
MEEKNIEYLKYLDTLLLYLSNGIKSTRFSDDLYKALDENQIYFSLIEVTELTSFSEGRIDINGLDIQNFKKQVFKEAVEYLKDLRLVSTRQEDAKEKISLTYTGRIKLTATFVEEYEKEKVDKKLRTTHLETSISLSKLQKITILLALFLSAGALAVSIISLSNKSDNTYYNSCNALKEHKTNPKIQSSRYIKVKDVFKETSNSSKNLSHDSLNKKAVQK